MTTATPRKQSRQRLDGWARRYLLATAWLAGIATTAATLTYSYPETLADLREPLILIHDLTGDGAILTTGAYLTVHLRRVWKMSGLMLSWSSGLFLVIIWSIAAITGLIGQFDTLEPGSILYGVHIGTSIASIVLACGHGAWAYRPRRPRKDGRNNA